MLRAKKPNLQKSPVIVEYVGERISIIPAHHPQLLEFIEEFATKEYSINPKTGQKALYFRRGSTSLRKIKEDILIGKAAEIAAFTFLSQSNFSPSTPDFTIYPYNQRSYEADLSCSLYHYHVKSTTNRTSPSWLFQSNDPLTSPYPPNNNVLLLTTATGPVYYTRSDSVNPSFPITVTIEWAIGSKDFSPLFTPPILYKQSKNKVAIYHSHILSLYQSASQPL